MTTITIQADDTAAAMEQIAKQLGPEALILSTTKQEGKIIMKASNKAPAKHTPAHDQTHDRARADEAVNFQHLFAQNLTGQNLAGQNLTGQNLTAQNLATPEAHTARAMLHALSLMADRIEQMDHHLSRMLAFISSAPDLKTLQDSPALMLQRAGFSLHCLNNLQAAYAGQPHATGMHAFLHQLAEKLADPLAETMLKKRVLCIIGPSGAGRTTLTAKLGASLNGQTQIAFGHVGNDRGDGHGDNRGNDRGDGHGNNRGDDPNIASKLKNYAQMLHCPFFARASLTPHDLQNTLDRLGNKLGDNLGDNLGNQARLILDITLPPDQAVAQIKMLEAGLGTDALGCILCLSGGSSPQLIDGQVAHFAALHPVIALTKLDECEVSAAELSALYDAQMPIALLSGTKSVIGALAIATPKILSQYLKEHFS